MRDYRAGDLTKEDDHDTAFAGVARAIRSSAWHEVTYLAGLWKDLFGYDMFWCVGLTTLDKERFRAQAAATMPAPTE